jgi:hypothetical protein
MMERRNNGGSAAWLGEWFCAGELYVERDYELFSVLAGVRGDAPAISQPRGVPKDASSAFRGFAKQISEELPGAVHSHSWLTLAELLAYDLGQEFYDDSLVTERDAEGRIVDTTDAFNKNLPNSGPVGRRKVFSLGAPNHWGREQWDMIINEMKLVRDHWELTNEDVRFCFFFYA